MQVDDIEVWGLKAGSGPLIVLQNGMWIDSLENGVASAFFTALTRHFTVISFDPRGQGRTALGRGVISYGRFASDTVRLLDVLGIEKAHFIGHSDGGCIQLNLLLDYPERVLSSTLIGTLYDLGNYNPQTRAVFAAWYDQTTRNDDTALEASVKQLMPAYAKVSPQPERLIEVLRGRRACWSTEPYISPVQMARIRKPVLVIRNAKDEYIRPETFDELARFIPGAKLVDFPDLSHNLTPHVGPLAQAAADFVATLG